MEILESQTTTVQIDHITDGQPLRYKTREEWLHAAIKLMASMFDDLAAPLPNNIRVSIGLPHCPMHGEMGLDDA